MINETDGSTTTTLCNIDTLIQLPGDQFGILSQTVCDGHLDLELTPIVSDVTTIEGQLPNDGGDHVGRLIYITDAVPVAATHCAFSWADYPCTVSDQDGGNSVTSTCSLPDTLVVAVGHQFDILSQAPCNGRLDLILTVKSPEALINLLIGEVQDLIDANVLNQAGNGLLAILDTVLSGVQNDRPSALAQLNAFINAVEGFISGGLLTAEQGQALIDAVQSIIDQLNL